MNIDKNAIRQLRVEGHRMLKVADVLERLTKRADDYRFNPILHSKMSPSARKRISIAQKKRWAKKRAK